MPEALQTVADLRIGYANSNMPGGDPFDGVGFVKDDKIVLQKHPAFWLFLLSAQERKEEGVIEHQHIGRQHVATGALVKANLPAAFHKVRTLAALPRAAQAAFRTDLLPHV